MNREYNVALGYEIVMKVNNGVEEIEREDTKLNFLGVECYNNSTDRTTLNKCNSIYEILKKMLMKLDKLSLGKHLIFLKYYEKDEVYFNKDVIFSFDVTSKFVSIYSYTTKEGQPYSLYERKMLLKIELSSRKILSSEDKEFRILIESILPKKNKRKKVIKKVKEDPLKKEISERVKLFEKTYKLKYKKIGHINKEVELSLVNGLLESFEELEKRVGLKNYNLLNNVLITNSRTTWGKYDETGGNIEISKFVKLDDLKPTVYHEYGHHMYKSYLNRGQKYRNLLSELINMLRKMDTLMSIRENAMNRTYVCVDEKGNKTEKKYSNNRDSLTRFEKYLLESTEVFARLVECSFGNLEKTSENSNWRFEENELELFDKYLSRLMK